MARVKYTDPRSHRRGLRVVNPRDTLVEVVVISDDSSHSEEGVGAIAPSVSNDSVELSDNEEVEVGDLAIIPYVGATQDHPKPLGDDNSWFNELHTQPSSPASFEIRVEEHEPVPQDADEEDLQVPDEMEEEEDLPRRDEIEEEEDLPRRDEIEDEDMLATLARNLTPEQQEKLLQDVWLGLLEETHDEVEAEDEMQAAAELAQTLEDIREEVVHLPGANDEEPEHVPEANVEEPVHVPEANDEEPEHVPIGETLHYTLSEHVR